MKVATMQPKTKLLERRAFLGRAGIGSVALASLLAEENKGVLASEDAPYRGPARAKRVIWLTMAGGPSHLETFDFKPQLAKLDGKPMPESYTRGQQLAQLQGQALYCLAPQFPFQRFGKCGAEISTLFPGLGSIADEICIVRSMVTDAINHDPAHQFMNTGSQLAGKPSMGAWVTYGLGSDAKDLPGFVVMVSTGIGRPPQPIAARQWSSGFLPGKFQGVQMRSKGDPVLYLPNADGIDREQQRADLMAIQQLNGIHHQRTGDPEIQTRIAQYELAFEMQRSVPELADLGQESQETLDLYGCKPGDGSFASNCLMARRLAERGVRFIQLYHRDWDHHNGIREGMEQKAKETDRASAALIQDLSRRGLLKDTLVVWSGEFGRTPMSQTNKGTAGRDHHNLAFSLWMAGGGVQSGKVYGATDELGYASVENIVTVHDLHATMLHLLGIDHERFLVRHQGLDTRLTGVEPAKVVHDILI